MDSSVPSSIVSSSIKALNAGIASHNPFVDASTVREPDVWINRTADSPEININARSYLQAAYGRVCRGETVAAVTLLGQTGTGKTHELNQLRHHVQTTARQGLFVYLNVQQFSEGQAIRQQLLRGICDSFVRRMPSGLLQWQQLAIALANHALSGLDNGRKQFAPHSVLELLSRNSLEQNQAWIDRITETFFRVRPEIDDPDLVRAIFWTLCPHQLPYARKWLSGLTIASWKRNELGLPQPRNHNPESHAWQTVLNLLAVIEYYAPLTIAFDCFEHPEIPEPGVQKERVAVGLIKWLGDRLRTRTRRFGVLFTCAMHPDTWDLVKDHFGSVSQFAHDRGEPTQLQPADAATIEQAIECWLQTFYQARNLVPPTPLYPFDQAQVAALVRESVDLHDAIDWCADNFQPIEADPLEPLELRFNAILRELTDSKFDESGLGDDWEISQAIGQVFLQLKGCELTIDSPLPVEASDPESPADPETNPSPDHSDRSDHSEAIDVENSPPAAISFRVHDVILSPKSRTFPVLIELEILNVATSPHPVDSPPIDPFPPESSSSHSSSSHSSQTPLHILRLGLGSLTSTNGRQLCAQLDRCWQAIDTEGDDPNHWTLGCLVRPLGATIPAHWKAAPIYERFAQHDRGLVIEFSLDDIAPLLALKRLEAEIREQEATTSQAIEASAAPNTNEVAACEVTSTHSASTASTTSSTSSPSPSSKPPESPDSTTHPEHPEREVNTIADESEEHTTTSSIDPDPETLDPALKPKPESELESESEPEPEFEPDEPDEPEIVSAEFNDFVTLPLVIDNHRFSQFPSAKPIRDLPLTHEMLAAWIDRENIAIENLIVCTVIGRAVSDLTQHQRLT